MFEQLKERYYQKRIVGRCYQVSDCPSGWYFEYYLIIKDKQKNKLIPYTNFILETYYEKEMEIEQLKISGYLNKEDLEAKIKTIESKNK